MDTDPVFSHTCGENVRISEDGSEATWEQIYSGGIAFSEKPLRKSDPQIRLELTGSSHVDIGVSQTDPKNMKKVRDFYSSEEFKVINSVKMHRSTCEVFLKNTGDRVISPSGDNVSSVPINRGRDVWIAFYIKFGNAKVSVESPNKFHEVAGENIEFGESERNVAKLRVQNPAAICCIDRNLHQSSESVTIVIKPLMNEEGKPSRLYHLTLGMSNIRPHDLHIADPQSISISRRSNGMFQSRWLPIQKFERRHKKEKGLYIDECAGKLTIDVTPEGNIQHSHTNRPLGVFHTELNPLYIVLELFRVSVQISGKSRLRRADSRYAEIRPANRAHQVNAPCSYIKPIYHVEPCESSWPGATGGSSADILNQLRVLGESAGDDYLTFGDKMDDTIKCMMNLEVQPDSGAGGLAQPTDVDRNCRSAPTVSGSTSDRDSMESLFNQIETKMETMLNSLDVTQNDIRGIKDTQTEWQDKMYTKFKDMKKQWFTLTKQNRATDMVNLENTIRQNYTTLVDTLDPFPFVYRLYENATIDQRDKQTLDDMKGQSISICDINVKLLGRLQTGLVKRAKIIDALEYSGQRHLQDKILPSST